MKCRQCNHENKDGAQFCVKCGAPIATGHRCRACGAESKPGANFCKKCGQTLVKTPAPAPAPEPAGSAPQAPAEQSVKANQSNKQKKPEMGTVEPAPEQPKQPSNFSNKPLWLIISAAVIALGVAKGNKFDDAIMLDVQGRVTETTSANIFVFRNEKLETPHLKIGVLAGVTRGIVLQLAKKNNIVCYESDIFPDIEGNQ